MDYLDFIKRMTLSQEYRRNSLQKLPGEISDYILQLATNNTYDKFLQLQKLLQTVSQHSSRWTHPGTYWIERESRNTPLLLIGSIRTYLPPLLEENLYDLFHFGMIRTFLVSFDGLPDDIFGEVITEKIYEHTEHLPFYNLNVFSGVPQYRNGIFYPAKHKIIINENYDLPGPLFSHWNNELLSMEQIKNLPTEYELTGMNDVRLIVKTNSVELFEKIPMEESDDDDDIQIIPYPSGIF